MPYHSSTYLVKFNEYFSKKTQKSIAHPVEMALMELEGTSPTAGYDRDFSDFTNAWNDISGTSPEDEQNLTELGSMINNPSGDSGTVFENDGFYNPGEKTNSTHENHVDP